MTGLHTFLVRTNDFRGSLAVADELAHVADEADDESCMAMSDWLRGSSNYFMGNQGIARRYYESGFARGGVRIGRHFGLDYRVRALVGFARVLGLTGFPEQAARMARRALEEARSTGKPLDMCFSLIFTCHVFLWSGDLDAAGDCLGQLTSHPYWHVMPGFHPEGHAMQGELHLLRGEIGEAAEVLRRALREMKASRQTSMRPIAECRLAEAALALGQTEEARALVDEAIEHAHPDGEQADAPELLRVKAAVLLALPTPELTEAENCLVQSLAHARRQGARSWELRTTMTLARLRMAQQRAADARDLLLSSYRQFTEGFATRDLVAARQLLRELGHRDAAEAGAATALAIANSYKLPPD
jgi:tetratricopeptide (TPR) repeat protein